MRSGNRVRRPAVGRAGLRSALGAAKPHSGGERRPDRPELQADTETETQADTLSYRHSELQADTETRAHTNSHIMPQMSHTRMHYEHTV